MAALTVVALAPEDNPDAALLALQDELAAADEVWEALYKQRVVAESACFALAPPPPAEPVHDYTAIRKALMDGQPLAPKTIKLMKAYDQANRARREAMEQAEVKSGLKAAEDAVNAADRVRLAIRDKIIRKRARTLSGMIFKARYAADHFPGDPDEDVMLSIVDDLVAMERT
jgi:hypothetical protein